MVWFEQNQEWSYLEMTANTVYVNGLSEFALKQGQKQQCEP